MRRNFSRKTRRSRSAVQVPRASIHRRDYLVRKRNRRVLSSLSISLLLLLSCTGLLISDYLGEEFALIMTITPLFLLFIWVLVILFHEEKETNENSHHFQQVAGEFYSNATDSSDGEYVAQNLIRIPKNNARNDEQSGYLIQNQPD